MAPAARSVLGSPKVLSPAELSFGIDLPPFGASSVPDPELDSGAELHVGYCTTNLGHPVV